VAHNLPTQLAGLVGREAELAELRALIAAHRLVTITGPGGTGKTRLGIAVAADVLSRFTDGVWLTELAALTDEDLVGSAIASALGVHESAGDAVADSIARHLGAKSVLVVLDNCEHVVDSAAKTVETLLRATSDVHVLATSQETLGIAGETAYPLAPLPTADAVALFEQSARAADPGFRLDEGGAVAAQTICAQLDGIPLAVQLAAARTRVLTPDQILDRLSDRFRLLTGGERGAPDRHRTLAAAVDWSHDLLAPAEQVLYRRLSVFAGGAPLEAIESICSDDHLDSLDIIDLVQRLVERSLLIRDPSGAEPHYRMLSTIHAHAAAKCVDADELRALHDRHLVWFRARAEAAYWGVRGNDAQRWTEVARADTDNMRAALQWALESGQIETGLDTYRYLYRSWIGQGFLREGIRWGERLLAVASDQASIAKARALGCLADLRWKWPSRSATPPPRPSSNTSGRRWPPIGTDRPRR
jgi:non-specific serine/threonine protein kinase